MKYFVNSLWVFFFASLVGCTAVRRGIVGLFSFDDKKQITTKDGSASLMPTEPSTNSTDQIQLQRLVNGFESITDIQFLPSDNARAVVLEKSGQASLVDFIKNQKSKVFSVKVPTESELGLLGLAFHPDFAVNRKFYVHYNPRSDRSRISEWEWVDHVGSPNPVSARELRVLMEIEQPYQNHNGGSLVFGTDRMLYIGMGDGGWRGDPENRAQNPKSLLGKMLRIDVERPLSNSSKAYGIPKDNPFLDHNDFAPEVFALGLRNPWKFSFDSKGRLVAGDVGQDKWEEITFVGKGANLGWRVFEGSHCYEPDNDCEKALNAQHLGPIAEYDHKMGASITGGFEYRGRHVPALVNRYVFGDFITGRIWSIVLPSETPPKPLTGNQLKLHGKWDILISTFAQAPDGEIYVADYASGSIFKIAAAP